MEVVAARKINIPSSGKITVSFSFPKRLDAVTQFPNALSWYDSQFWPVQTKTRSSEENELLTEEKILPIVLAGRILIVLELGKRGTTVALEGSLSPSKSKGAERVMSPDAVLPVIRNASSDSFASVM